MKFIFDSQDEQNILQQMLRNRDKAESMGQAYAQRGKSKQAADWVESAQQVETKIMLLEQAFQHKN
jgi:uncharacterized protein YfcZ (UPF0381/DUF406 family)